jgi:hypothetical protein
VEYPAALSDFQLISDWASLSFVTERHAASYQTPTQAPAKLQAVLSCCGPTVAPSRPSDTVRLFSSSATSLAAARFPPPPLA